MAKRKAAEDGAGSPSKKQCHASSPPEPTSSRPALPFDRESVAPLPQDAFDIFASFCPASVADSWADFINGQRQDDTWQPTYQAEVYLFFGMLIYMSFCPMPAIKDYWATSTNSAIHPISRFMTRERFLGVYRRFCAGDASVSVATMSDKVRLWCRRIKAPSAFRKQFYVQIFARFGQQVALRNKGLAAPEMLQQTHEKARRPKRGHCAFCSSKRRNVLFEQTQLSVAPAQRYVVITGCNQCNVALCDNKKRRCWDRWHEGSGSSC